MPNHLRSNDLVHILDGLQNAFAVVSVAAIA